MSDKTATLQNNKSHISVKMLAITAMSLVLVYVFTAVVNIRLPISINGGLIHLGNVPLFLAAILFGKKVGMVAGGLGMALFDITSGWLPYAPFTLVIVGAMGLVVGWITQNNRSYWRVLIALIAACAIKIGGYYLAEVIIYSNWIAPVTSIPGNLIQIAAGAVITLVVLPPLRIAAEKTILRGA